MKTYLCYYKLWLGEALETKNEILYIHCLVEANTSEAAMEQLVTIHGKGYTLSPKGCLGEFNLKMAKEYLKNDQFIRLFSTNTKHE